MIKFEETSISGVYVGTPQKHADMRGDFSEWFRADQLPFPLDVQQANVVQSVAGTVRGMHYTLGAGQAKYVTCAYGSIYDVLVDVREGSPTFGAVAGFLLSPASRSVLAIPTGIAHGYCSIETSVVIYLCSSTYSPGDDVAISPVDPELNITWPILTPLIAHRDRIAPTARELHAQGKLPTYTK